jgi:hypothetical protein
MPAEIYQGPFSEPITSTTAGLTYLIRGAEDELDARNTLVDGAPLLYDNKVQEDYEITDLKIPGGGWFKATVKYKARSTGLPAGGGGQEPRREISFSIAGEERDEQIYSGESTTYLAEGWTQKIPTGVVRAKRQSNGRYEIVGDTLRASVMRFTIRRKFFKYGLTDELVNTIEGLYDCVNRSSFLGWGAGTVIFDGADGSQVGEDTEVQFNFRRSRFIERTTDGIVWSASPFDHVWMLDDSETVGGVTISRIKEVHINYKTRDDLNKLPL